MSDLQNTELLRKFYNEMARKNGPEMGQCYHPEAEFEDPVFGRLNARQTGVMWEMLLHRVGEEFKINWEIADSDGKSVKTRLEASYLFGKDKRAVHNIITSEFEFRDGKIIRQRDTFSFWRWSSMALGGVGRLLGWSGWFQSRVRHSSLKLLDRFEERNS